MVNRISIRKKIMTGRLLLFCISLLLIIPTFSGAQNYTNYTWYFCNRSIEFNRTNKEPNISTGTAVLTGPVAVAADPATGNILFYTDGVNVYDASHQLMVNGAGLQGDPSGNQPVVLGQVPGQPDQYYIITNSPSGSITYSIVDLGVQGNPGSIPLGEVVNASKNTAIGSLTNQSPAMITIPHENGTDFFLITHTEGTNTYNVTHFNSSGVSSVSTYSNIGLIEMAANFAYNPTTGQLAVAPGESSRNAELLTFDPASGTVVLEAALPLTGTSSTAGIYDIEWSPNGEYLYISTSGTNGQPDLVQYDLTNLNPTGGLITPVSVLPQPNAITASYGIQSGPDGNLYHLYESGGQILMGVINDPDSTAALVNYDAEAFAGSFCTTQFSTGIPAHPVTIDIDFEGTGCANVPTQLFPNVTPAADSLHWFITGDPTPFSTAWSPVYTFEQAGPVSITVVAYLGGEATSFEKTINITDFDTQITLEPEVTGCHDEFTDAIVRPPGWVPCGPGGTPCLTVEAQIQGTQGTIRWYGPDGLMADQTTTTLTPPRPGYYYIVVGDGACAAYAGVNVKEYEVPDPRANVWYFGNGVGLDFNPLFREPSEPIEVLNGPMNAPEGTATISDRNGKAVLYTDGSTVWNRNGDIVATDIGGSPTATQSSVIMAVPGDETLYYIFTTQEIDDGTFELRYTLFDLKLNGGTGGIVDPDGDPSTLPPSTVLFTRSTERVLAVGDFILAHEYGSNTFRAYRLTPDGIAAPVISNIGSDHSVTSPESGEGYMVYGSGRLAVALNNTIEIFDYDVATGEVTNFRSVAAPGPVYGVAFSSSGNKMYATVLGNPGQIIEYYYDEDLDQYVQMPTPIVMTGAESSQPGAMQYGPDGQLYVAVSGRDKLSSITPQDDEDTQSGFQLDATPALGGTVNLGLPNFVQQIANPIQGPGVTVPVVCINTEAEFTATGKDNTIDEFSWEFFDPQGNPIALNPSDTSTVVLTFTQPGTYRYRVKIWNKCEGTEQDPYFLEDDTFEVNDIPPPPPMLAGEPGVICDETGVTLIAADPHVDGNTYLWNTGSDQRTIQVTTPGRYSVTVTSEVGCVNTGETLIAPYFGNVTLGPDVEVCEDTPHQIEIAAIFPNATWNWFVNGVQQPTPNVENVFPVDTSTPGAKTIRLELTDNICSISDEVIVNVNPIPVFSTVVQPDTDCDPNVNNGEIALTITAPTARFLSYSINSNPPQSGSDVQVGDVVPPFAGLGAGVYTITVADQLSGCATTNVENIDNNDFAFTPVQTPSGLCHPLMSIDVSGLPGSDPYDYQIFDPSGALVRAGTGTAPNFTTETLPPTDGSYTIQLRNAAGCQVSEIVDIQQGPSYDVFIDNSLVCSNNQVQLAYATPPPNADAIPSWTATAPNGTGNGIISVTGNTATLAVGTWVVKVVAEGPSACPGEATRTVTVGPPLTADFTQSDACIDPVVLTSTPTGSQYIHRWSRNGGAPFAFTPNISLSPADDGNSFMVTVINTQTGCSDDSEDRVVRIVEPFTVDITMPPFACEGTEFQVVATASRPDVTQYQWFLNGGALAHTGAVLTANQAGTYRVIGSLEGCVSPPAERSITPNPAPQVTLGPMQRICPYPGPAPTRTATIDAGAGYASYDWFRVEGNAVIPLNATGRQYVADAGGVYRVEVTDEDGCPNTADVEIVQECDPIISAPNAFRPGSSVSPNEAFAVVTQFITDEDFQIFIFNRWGEMVYESSNRSFKWNGAYKGSGQLLPAGTYAYVVRYRSEYHPEDGIQEFRGGVVLMR